MFVNPLGKTKKWLRQNLDNKNLFIYNHYSDIVKMIADWQVNGVKINEQKFNRLKKLIEQKIVKILNEINELEAVKKFKKKYGKDFNIKSTQQLNDLAKILRIKPLYKTKSGLISFSTKYLDEYIQKHDGEARRFLELLKEFRFFSKALLSYVNSIPKELDDNWIFRTAFNICGTKTGRLSSYFHTLGSRNEFNKNFKRLIESRWKDGVIVSADFCLTPDTLVYTDKGWKELIKVIPGEDKVLNDKGEWLDVYCIVDRGYGDVYEIETEKGFKIKCTLNHKFMCINNEGKYVLATMGDIIDNGYYVAMKSIDEGTFKTLDALFFDKIKSTKYLGRQKVYDLSVSGNHLFIANGFVVKNSQAEPRTIASLSGDEKLIQVYKDGKDIYKTMASVVYNIPYDEVPKDLRNKMKQLVLAVLYGMSSKTFAQNTGIDIEEAKKILNKFFEEFKGVANWIQRQHVSVLQNRYIKTPLKRIIKIAPELFVSDENKVKRYAQNFPIQSTASETILVIIKEFWRFLKDFGYQSKIVASVHDSIIVDTKLDELFDIIFYMKLFCEKYYMRYFEDFIKAPFVIEQQIGVSWGNSLEISSMVINQNDAEIVCEGYIEDLLALLERLSLKYKVSYDIIEEEDVEIDEEILLINNKQKIGKYKIKLERR